MRIKRYRPFWSYDVVKTENWLDSLSEQGYELKGLNHITRCFYFEKSESQLREHRIVYNEKPGHELSRTLSDDSWFGLVQIGNWAIVGNENVNEHKFKPVRDGIIKRNDKVWVMHQYFLIFLLSYIVGIVTTSELSSSNRTTEIVASPFWTITILVALSLVLLSIISIYSLVKISRTNKVLSHQIEKIDFEEQPLQYNGKLIKKRKFGWMYAPDLLENWLEDMETKGFHLVKVSTFGTTFYFTKGEARKVTYCADYQNMEDVNYFNIHKDFGWKEIYTSWGKVQKWTIWGRQIGDTEERTHIYDDAEHLLKHSKRIMKTNFSISIFLIIIYLFNLLLNLSSFFFFFDVRVMGIVVNGMGIGLFGFLTVRTWLYYKRMKGKAEHI